MKLEITIDEKELVIMKKLNESVGHMIVHKKSPVPSKKEGDEEFNRLREVVLREWYNRCGFIILNTIQSETSYPKLLDD